MRAGQTYVFRAQATGTKPISYQWYRNGQVLEGQKSAVLVRSGLKTSDSGVYWVVASNDAGTVRSGSARLTVKAGSSGSRSIAKMGGEVKEKKPEGAVLRLEEKSGGTVRVSVDLKGLKSSVSGTTLELSYPTDVLKLVGEGSHRAGKMVPERLKNTVYWNCLLYTSPSPRDRTRSRMPSSA